MLRTNTDLDPLDAMLCYKQLWTVEQTFRTAKHLLTTRPIFHKLDETIRGHVFCSFLALVLKKALEDRIATLNRAVSWTDIIADLNSLTQTEIEQEGKRFIVRLHRAPQQVSHSAPPALRYHRPCAQSSTIDPKNVVPRRRRDAICHCGSITSPNQL